MRRVLAIVGAAAIIASTAPLAARLWWIFELFTHFRVQLVAGLIVLGIVFAVRRAYRWCGVLAACAALNVAPLVPYLGSAAAGESAAAGTESAPTLTVLAVNVRASNTEYVALLDAVSRENPDVVLVVEFTDAWAERLAPLAAQYPHQFALPRNDAFGITLFSRYSLETAHEPALGPTAVIDARVAMPRGAVRLVGVHLRPPMSSRFAHERNTELAALAAYVAAIEEPLVVLGDFNMTPYSPYFTSFLAASGLRDARLGFGPGFTWPTFFPLLGVPIDHCLVSEAFTVAQYRRLPAFGSDHYPVLARLVQE